MSPVLLQRNTSLILRMMDSGDLVENGFTDPSPTVDGATKEADFKVIETSVAAEGENKEDGDFQGAICVSFDLNSNGSDEERFLRYFKADYRLISKWQMPNKVSKKAKCYNKRIERKSFGTSYQIPRPRSSTLRTERRTILATTRGTLWGSPPREG